MRAGPIATGLLACILGISGCGEETTPGTADGVCGGQVPAGETCNSFVDLSTPITPTCVTGEMPIGMGGNIVDGTYFLTEQIYYNEPGCPNMPIGSTLVISGSCIQSVNGQWSVTSSTSIAVQGNSITKTHTCLSSAMRPEEVTFDEPTHTFTATPTTFTVFQLNSAANNPNPDRVEVFTRR